MEDINYKPAGYSYLITTMRMWRLNNTKSTEVN